MAKRTNHNRIYRIECFCDANKLGDVLWQLKGLVYDLTPTPVVNAAKTKPNGGLKALTGGKFEDLFARHLIDHKISEVDATAMRQFMTSIGGAQSSYTYFLNKARVAGLLKKIPGKNSRYVRWKVNPAKVKQVAHIAKAEA